MDKKKLIMGGVAVILIAGGVFTAGKSIERRNQAPEPLK